VFHDTVNRFGGSPCEHALFAPRVLLPPEGGTGCERGRCLPTAPDGNRAADSSVATSSCVEDGTRLRASARVLPSSPTVERDLLVRKSPRPRDRPLVKESGSK